MKRAQSPLSAKSARALACADVATPTAMAPLSRLLLPEEARRALAGLQLRSGARRACVLPRGRL